MTGISSFDRCRRFEVLAVVLPACGVLSACQPQSSRLPWPTSASEHPSVHADVRTLNDYRRTSSSVLVREVTRPRRAALDYAAYHQNFMIDDPAPEETDAAPAQAADTTNPFAGWLDKTSLQADIERTPLSEKERLDAFAFAPLVEYLSKKRVPGAESLEELGSKVREEAWGLPRRAGIANQSIAELFVHGDESRGRELWVKIEFQPWFRALGNLPDQDGDGFPELYGNIRKDKIEPGLFDAIRKDYGGAVLSPAEVKAWANQLASYWYPSFNTDLLPPGSVWPDDATEPEIEKELGGRTFANPTIVLRGKPHGNATYNIFLVKGAEASSGSTSGSRALPALELPKTRPAAEVDGIRKLVEKELADHGGSWGKWQASVAPLHQAVKKRLKSAPPAVKAFAGEDGYLFFRNSMEFVAGGDLERQRRGKNPLPVIVEFKKALEARGVDFLFVPVPTKVEVFPDKLDPKHAKLAGEIVNPFARKFLLSLAKAGVEVVDLLEPFLAARRSGDPSGSEPLYQKQDTHWTDRGLRMTADLLAARIQRYPWYAGISRHSRDYKTRATEFTRFGDLHSRLPESQKSAYRPETLKALQVLNADGTPYDDDPDSPIVLLGDSFTGVYQLTDAEHAGVSAHVAKGIGYPVDLVMSYGGGPNVRNKLMRRGVEALAQKKLVIWLMTARDLYDYWENWEALEKK